MRQCFDAYQAALRIWDSLAEENPRLMGIPQSLLNDPSDSAQKRVQRMKRNYSFDRARCFLPVAAATNVMLVMSARGWVSLCQNLLSHALPECRRLGELVRDELQISAPRMLKHAQATESNQRALARDFEKLVALAQKSPLEEESAKPMLSLLRPEGTSQQEITEDLASHANRYAPVGNSLQRVGVRFGWSAIGFAEIRDLNRHRTGAKYCPQVPKGFYSALDQIPANAGEQKVNLLKQVETGRGATAKASRLLCDAVPTYIYWSVLGTEYPFEHLTTADKFIYEAELRTGTGAHYRYAKHLRDILALWYEQFPATKGLILEGSAEPE